MPYPSRRDILKLLAAAAATEVILPGKLAAEISKIPSLKYSLFFGAEDLARMRRVFNEDPTFTAYREGLLNFDMDGQRRFLREEVDTNNRYVHIGLVGRIAEQMAFRYALTGDVDAAELAAEAVRKILEFPRWDFYMEAGQTIGVQRAASATTAISLTSDWLGDAISDDERSHWIAVMAERGCEACYLGLHGIRYPREVKGWHFDSTSVFFLTRPHHRTDLNRRPEITQETNLRAIPSAALTIGAIVHRFENGPNETNERWLEMATANAIGFAELFSEDGSYNEGVGYANYSSLHLVQAIELLARHNATDLQDVVNWPGYARYVLNMLMPTNEDSYEIVNFGDNGNAKPGRPTNVERTAVPAWIARMYGDETAQWLSNLRTGVRDHWSLIWHDPGVKETAPEPGPRLWISDLDWVVARNGWDPDDIVVAMRSGPPANHEHADRNSIIVKCFGEQLVTDPHRPPYLFAEPDWRMRLTEGHSAILIDGKGHEHHNGVEGTNASKSFARIVESQEGDGYAYWLSDCTQPYRLVDLNVRRVVRKIVVLYDVPAVIVVDHVQKFETPSTVEARFFAYNLDANGSVEAATDGFITTRPGAVMRAHSVSDKSLSFGVGKLAITEEVAAWHPFGSVTTESGTDITIVTVLAIGRTADSIPAVAISDVHGGSAVVQIGDRMIEEGRIIIRPYE